jgi:hypothetical protein
MRLFIYVFYTVLFLIAVFAISFLSVYYAWHVSKMQHINLFEDYFDIFPSLEHSVVIVAVPLLLIRKILVFCEKQAVYFYKNYIERTVYLKYFLINLGVYFSVFTGIGMLGWTLCHYLNIDLFNHYYNKPLSVEHHITAFMMTIFAYKPLIRKSKKITEKVFFHYYETKGRHISIETKAYVHKRDKGKCTECNSKRKLEYDHIKPFARGGSNRAYNIQLLCFKCNRKKSDNY